VESLVPIESIEKPGSLLADVLVIDKHSAIIHENGDDVEYLELGLSNPTPGPRAFLALDQRTILQGGQ